MSCLLDAIPCGKENIKHYALELGEKCIGTAIGGAIIAGITSILEISLLAANPIGAAALCGGLALSEYFEGKCIHYIATKLYKNINDKEVCKSLMNLVAKVVLGVKMTIWILGATFAASYMGVPVVAGVFIVIGAGIALEGFKLLKNWIQTRRAEMENEQNAAYNHAYGLDSTTTDVRATNVQTYAQNEELHTANYNTHQQSNQQYGQQSYSTQ